jgi:hypothetical protein
LDCAHGAQSNYTANIKSEYAEKKFHRVIGAKLATWTRMSENIKEDMGKASRRSLEIISLFRYVVKHLLPWATVARWYTYFLHFGGSCNIRCWHILSVYFTAILYNLLPFGIPILWSFGIFSPFWYVVPRKIWQPLHGPPRDIFLHFRHSFKTPLSR